ncbi:unnamed protein product [Arabis nemorensis]|uniref:MBD domain-containing protein n=1 Tax=Arabis nemorensis TaxID=586526 RepID=A0A565B7I3_9BRAS|nr:unnamed protein product [Arabis nemorensis]
MEIGEGSKSGHRSQKRLSRGSVRISLMESVDNLSEEGIKTLRTVNRKRPKPLGEIPFTSSAIFDNTCPRYDWLCSGWIVEERSKLSDRLYRYYYDPMGRVYDARYKVEDLCQDIEKNRVVIILGD